MRSAVWFYLGLFTHNNRMDTMSANVLEIDGEPFVIAKKEYLAALQSDNAALAKRDAGEVRT